MEASGPEEARPYDAASVLCGMYRTSKEAPSAFHAEYQATVTWVLELIDQSAPQKLEVPPTYPEGHSRSADAVPGASALHYAAGCGCLEVCELLLKRCVRLNFQTDGQGQTPLTWAATHGMAQIAELLLSQGADPAHADELGRTPLHHAASRGFGRVCEALLAAPSGRDITERRCSQGLTALHAAASSGSLGVCRALVERGRADCAALTARERRTPLHVAAARGHAEAVGYLAKADTSVFVFEDASGHTAVQRARAGRHVEAVAALAGLEQEFGQLAEDWSHRMNLGAKDGEAPGDLTGAEVTLHIAAPKVCRADADELELSCQVTDLEYRLLEYVLEVRNCDRLHPGAPPMRVYYTRQGEQRKVDQVDLTLPRRRDSGQEVWQPGCRHQFRVVGHFARQAWQPLLPWQVLSEWSKPVLIPAAREAPLRGSRRRSLPRGREM